MHYMADGNHHANKLIKNTDPNNVSLFWGRVYFPDDTTYWNYVKWIPTLEEVHYPSLYLPSIADVWVQKTICVNLKAENNADWKKFKNTDISGIVQIQCSNVFVLSLVNLQLGEKYVKVSLILLQVVTDLHSGLQIQTMPLHMPYTSWRIMAGQTWTALLLVTFLDPTILHAPFQFMQLRKSTCQM